MPDKCCVVRCRSNYKDEPKRSAFYFPEEEDLKWIRFVNRKDWEWTKSSVICVNHFEEKYVAIHPKKKLLKWKLKPIPSIYITPDSTVCVPSSVLAKVVPMRKSP